VLFHGSSHVLRVVDKSGHGVEVPDRVFTDDLDGRSPACSWVSCTKGRQAQQYRPAVLDSVLTETGLENRRAQ
jgi:hypothetical protein